MNRTPILAAAALFVLLPMEAADWAPLPPQVWGIKEDPVKGWKDAVVLEKRTSFRKTYNEYVYRVRIFSEAGRKAAQLPPFAEECYGFSGRVSYPDGRSVTLSRRQDFTEQTRKVETDEEMSRVLVPPGINADCVFELRWMESADRENKLPLPRSMGLHHEHRFGAPWATLSETVEMPQEFPFTYMLMPTRTRRPELKEKGGSRVYSISDLPAYRDEDYALPAQQDRPLFVLYHQPDDFRKLAQGSDMAPFWQQVAQWIWKDRYQTGVKRGKTFSELSRRILSQCKGQGDPARAREILALLNQEVANTDELTYAEAAARPKGAKVPEPEKLEEAARSKEISSRGMTVAFYQLLRDAGMKPLLGVVANRYRTLFRFGMPSPFQCEDMLVGVPDGRTIRWMDPGMRYAPQDLIWPAYQGTPILILDPDQDWKAREGAVPIQPGEFNTRAYSYQVTVGEDAHTFKVEASFRGFPEYAERRRYLPLEPAGQGRSLGKLLEERLKGATVKKAEVRNATDPRKPVTWEAEGVLEGEAGARRLTIHPFPGIPLPLAAPEDPDAERQTPVALPYLQTMTATSVILLPKGVPAPKVEPLRKGNRFGFVSWVAEPRSKGEQDELVVTVQISLTETMGPAASWNGVKAWLGWVKEACGRTVVLERSR